MNLEQINWDFNEVGNWPKPVKAGAIILACVLISLAWLYVDTSEQTAMLETAEKQELKLKQVFEAKQKKAVNLVAYELQLKDMREQFGAMLKQLPNKTEIPDLIIDVSQAGLASGLEFKLFQPQSEVDKGFYREKPMNIVVQGSYHELGEFVSNLAALPRIVTLHNVSLSGSGEKMKMAAIVKTYRYVEGQENDDG
ncbi:MAG: pilus assembly protein PilO [Cycloclasticus sp. symbiont of Poecilosclerida sp. M]|nr:MAG: pilus assembly protein PilO [Cycloclasticus sp. symbiont of Poecilosclerida sp. M]